METGLETGKRIAARLRQTPLPRPVSPIAEKMGVVSPEDRDAMKTWKRACAELYDGGDGKLSPGGRRLGRKRRGARRQLWKRIHQGARWAGGTPREERPRGASSPLAAAHAAGTHSAKGGRREDPLENGGADTPTGRAHGEALGVGAGDANGDVRVGTEVQTGHGPVGQRHGPPGTAHGAGGSTTGAAGGASMAGLLPPTLNNNEQVTGASKEQQFWHHNKHPCLVCSPSFLSLSQSQLTPSPLAKACILTCKPSGQEPRSSTKYLSIPMLWNDTPSMVEYRGRVGMVLGVYCLGI